MKDFLKKIRLIDQLTTEISISRDEFAARLRKHVDAGSLDMFSGMFEIFDSSENEYKGHVEINGFRIKRRRKFFDTNWNFSIATGSFRQHDDKLIIETEVNAFTGFVAVFYGLVLFIYLIFFIVFLASASSEGETFFFVPFLFVHAVFMLGIPYFIMRRSVKRMKYDLERELHYIAKK